MFYCFLSPIKWDDLTFSTKHWFATTLIVSLAYSRNVARNELLKSFRGFSFKNMRHCFQQLPLEFKWLTHVILFNRAVPHSTHNRSIESLVPSSLCFGAAESWERVRKVRSQVSTVLLVVRNYTIGLSYRYFVTCTCISPRISSYFRAIGPIGYCNTAPLKFYFFAVQESLLSFERAFS